VASVHGATDFNSLVRGDPRKGASFRGICHNRRRIVTVASFKEEPIQAREETCHLDFLLRQSATYVGRSLMGTRVPCKAKSMYRCIPTYLPFCLTTYVIGRQMGANLGPEKRLVPDGARQGGKGPSANFQQHKSVCSLRSPRSPRSPPPTTQTSQNGPFLPRLPRLSRQ
jgi:hypothetical protein